jgi:2-polyprenyl-3-methyl-5-hydroxy-6-metoxy-1,4-benzoquinol methylase
MPCPLCDAPDPKILSSKDRKGNELTTTCCKSCGLVFNNPIPSEMQLEEFYTHSYRKSYKSTSVPKRKHHVRYARSICSQISHIPQIYNNINTVLDVGAGSGEFSALMLSLGKQVDAIEPTQDYASYVQRMFDVPMFCGSITHFKTEKTYDLIRLNHVLEHMRDPTEKLLAMRNLLSKGGVLHVEVPNFVTYAKSKSPGNMFHYGHIYNFDHETLLAFAARAGLKPVAEISATSIYFTKCEPFEALPSTENAQRNIALHAQHIAGEFRPTGSSIARIKHKLFKALNEIITVRSLKTPHNIIRHYCAEIESLQNPNPPPREHSS